MIDKRPGAIAAVRAAREQDLLTTVRGGDHNAGGLGICDDGLVIDLSRMKGIRVLLWASIPTRRTKRQSPTGPRNTSTPCTRIQPEAPTSTS